MKPSRRASILRALAHATVPVLLTLAAATVSGCSLTQNDIVRLPTLHDVEPTGPEGRRCYDQCAQREMSCCWDSSIGGSMASVILEIAITQHCNASSPMETTTPSSQASPSVVSGTSSVRRRISGR